MNIIWTPFARVPRVTRVTRGIERDCWRVVRFARGALLCALHGSADALHHFPCAAPMALARSAGVWRGARRPGRMGRINYRLLAKRWHAQVRRGEQQHSRFIQGAQCLEGMS
jgi:hypothetical protein